MRPSRVFAGQVAVCGGGVVAIGDPPVKIQGDEAVLEDVDELLDTALRFRGGLVEDQAVVAANGASGVAVGDVLAFDQAHGAAHVRDHDLETLGLAGQGGDDMGLDLGPGDRTQHRLDRAAQDVGAGYAEPLRIGAVDEAIAAGLVDVTDQRRDAVGDLLGQRRESAVHRANQASPSTL